MAGANGGPRSSLAAALIDYLERSPDHPYAQVEAVDFAGENDVVDIVLEPELVQDRTVAIVEKEPVRLVFPPGDDGPPTVYSRREDFPIDLVHTNYERDGSGLCLCVWEENWGDLSRALTGQRLVERLRDWFARAGRGELHQAGQPVEPMIPATSSTMVVPPGPPPAVWHGIVIDDDDGRLTVLLDHSARKGGHPRVPFAIFSMEVALRFMARFTIVRRICRPSTISSRRWAAISRRLGSGCLTARRRRQRDSSLISPELRQAGGGGGLGALGIQPDSQGGRIT